MKDDKLNYIVEKLKKLSFVKVIWIFGSTIKKSRIYSDIDVAVYINPETEKNKDEVLSHGSDLIDISIFTDLPIIMQFEIAKEGKLLYKAKNFNLAELLSEVNVRYLDFKPLYERSLKLYKEKLKNGKIAASA